jgi:hypothetical protein
MQQISVTDAQLRYPEIDRFVVDQYCKVRDRPGRSVPHDLIKYHLVSLVEVTDLVSDSELQEEEKEDDFTDLPFVLEMATRAKRRELLTGLFHHLDTPISLHYKAVCTGCGARYESRIWGD